MYPFVSLRSSVFFDTHFVFSPRHPTPIRNQKIKATPMAMMPSESQMWPRRVGCWDLQRGGSDFGMARLGFTHIHDSWPVWSVSNRGEFTFHQERPAHDEVFFSFLGGEGFGPIFRQRQIETEPFFGSGFRFVSFGMFTWRPWNRPISDCGKLKVAYTSEN